MLGIGLGDEPNSTNEPENVVDSKIDSAEEPSLLSIALTRSSPGPRLKAPSIEELSERFPQLEILEKLGQGGMGAVYRVRQKSLDRVVALKILPILESNDPTFIERFQREARALAKLSHPNIVMVFEIGEADGLPYFLMEFVDGVNLRQAIQTGEMTPEEALRVVPQICEALQFAHDEGVVHRDIKPENVLLDKKGRVKIADFGLAKILAPSPDNFTLTSTNQIVGTPKYMAPEQIEHPDRVDHRSDIYSLGVVFYEILTGELPLGRFGPPSGKSSADEDLDDIVMRTLEKEPDRRYQNASEVQNAVNYYSNPYGSSTSVPPQKQPVSPRRRTNRPVTVPVEATNPPWWASAKGLMKLDEAADQLILEIEIVDHFGGIFKSDVKQIRLSLDTVVSIELSNPWLGMSPEVRIQTDSLEDLLGVQIADRGQIALKVEKRDVSKCKTLVERTSVLIGQTVPAMEDRNEIQQKPIAGATPVSNEPHPTVALSSLDREIVTNIKSMKWTGWSMILLAVIQIVFALAASIEAAWGPGTSFLAALALLWSLHGFLTGLNGILFLKGEPSKALNFFCMAPITPIAVLNIPVCLWGYFKIVKRAKFGEGELQYASTVVAEASRQGAQRWMGYVFSFCAIAELVAFFPLMVVGYNDSDLIPATCACALGFLLHAFFAIRVFQGTSRIERGIYFAVSLVPCVVTWPIVAPAALVALIQLFRSGRTRPNMRNPYV